MLEKGNDPNNKLINIGDHRIFKDKDGTASNSTWDKSALILDRNNLSNKINSLELKCNVSSNK
jgi:hypothetical protein